MLLENNTHIHVSIVKSREKKNLNRLKLNYFTICVLLWQTVTYKEMKLPTAIYICLYLSIKIISNNARLLLTNAITENISLADVTLMHFSLKIQLFRVKSKNKIGNKEIACNSQLQ